MRSRSWDGIVFGKQRDRRGDRCGIEKPGPYSRASRNLGYGPDRADYRRSPSRAPETVVDGRNLRLVLFERGKRARSTDASFSRSVRKREGEREREEQPSFSASSERHEDALRIPRGHRHHPHLRHQVGSAECRSIEGSYRERMRRDDGSPGASDERRRKLGVEHPCMLLLGWNRYESDLFIQQGRH